MKHRVHPPIKGQLGSKCSCGKSFATEIEAAKHADDENFDEQTKQDTKAPMPENTEPKPETTYAKPVVTPPPANNKVTVAGYLRNDIVRTKIDEMLGKRSNQFITALVASTNNVAHLSECTPVSVLNAALTVAALDLPINNNLGFAYIIPYKNKGVYEAQFQMGWKGFIQLAQRSGAYKTIAATAVYDGQLVSEDPLSGNVYDWKAKSSDKVIGYVARLELLSGFSKDIYMSMAEVQAHANRFSQSYRSGYDSPWKSDFDSMAQKTVIKQLISKFGPMSIDPQMQMAVERDQAVVEPDGNLDYIDNAPEIEDGIRSASTVSEVNEIMMGLPVADRKKVTAAAQARLAELVE